MVATYQTFINLFLVPLISVLLFYCRRGRKMQLNWELICYYAIFVVVNMLFAKIFLVALETLRGVPLLWGTFNYQVTAVVVALIVPILWEIVTKFFSVSVTVETVHEEEK